MSKSIQIRTCVAATLVCLLGASCSDVTDSDSLPGGKYPMTFTGSVEGLSATRAATNGKDTWTINDEVGVSVDGGSSSKTYKITDASTGAMKPSVTGNPCYWQQKTGQHILAWYPAAGAGNVNISDQSSGFANFDYLAADVTRNFITEAISLPFKHQMAKVKYILQKGDGISVADLSSATVKMKGYTLASFTNGKLTGAYAGNEEDNWITPIAADKEVLIIPQQMQGKQFIKVRINNTDYFYTPTNETDANLKAGNVYVYTITVKKTGLEVTLSPSIEWGQGDVTTEGSEATTFKVKIPAVVGVIPVIEGAAQSAGELYTTSGNSFSITLENRATCFNVKGGVCDVERTSTGPSYKFIYSNIRSNLELVYGGYPEVGDYYNSDGTWSPDYDKGKCIGVIFKSGAAAGDEAGNYDGKLTNGIHGYVVALQDALSTAGNWGTRGADTPITDVNDANATAYTGYSDTETIISTYSKGDKWNDYQAFKAIVDYRSSISAPDISSDWYLPSLAQLYDVYTALNTVSNPLITAGQGFTISATTDYGWYWTSSEKTNSGLDAWHVSFRDGSKGSNAKDGTNYDNGKRACYARAILTF